MPKLEDTLSAPLKYQPKNFGSKPEPDIIFSPEEKAQALTAIANADSANTFLYKLKLYNTEAKNSVDKDKTEEERYAAAKRMSELKLTDGEKKLAKAISQDRRITNVHTIEAQVSGYHKQIQDQIIQAKNKIAAAEDGFDRVDHSEFTKEEKARAEKDKMELAAKEKGALAGFKNFVNRLTSKPEVKGGSTALTSRAAKAKSNNKGQQL